MQKLLILLPLLLWLGQNEGQSISALVEPGEIVPDDTTTALTAIELLTKKFGLLQCVQLAGEAMVANIDDNWPLLDKADGWRNAGASLPTSLAEVIGHSSISIGGTEISLQGVDLWEVRGPGGVHVARGPVDVPLVNREERTYACGDSVSKHLILVHDGSSSFVPVAATLIQPGTNMAGGPISNDVRGPWYFTKNGDSGILFIPNHKEGSNPISVEDWKFDMDNLRVALGFAQVEATDRLQRLLRFGKFKALGSGRVEPRVKASYYNRFGEDEEGKLKCFIVSVPGEDGVFVITSAYSGFTMNSKTTSAFSGTLLMCLKISRALWESVGTALVRSTTKLGKLIDSVPFSDRGISNCVLEVRPQRDELIELNEGVDLSQQESLFALPELS